MVGSILAIVSNNIPTTFWILAHIYSNLLLLAEIYRELELTLPCPLGEEPVTLQIDAALIRENCPLSISTYEELLRMSHDGRNPHCSVYYGSYTCQRLLDARKRLYCSNANTQLHSFMPIQKLEAPRQIHFGLSAF